MRVSSLPVIASLSWVVACASSPVPAPRFANAPPVTIVNDRLDVSVPPARRRYLRTLHLYDSTFHRRIARGLELPGKLRALGINALDEVPDSTWFTNRIGVRHLTPDEIRIGPQDAGSPEPHTPWSVVSTKSGGQSVGLVIRDARGIEWLFKPDAAAYPEMESGAGAIVNRLLWAAGYNVPEDHVAYVKPADLVIAPGAKVAGKLRDAPLDRTELDRRLAGSYVDRDGRLRGLVSRLIDGRPLGGHPPEGVRADDPNDIIPHERRRELRGASPLFAWLDHVDNKDANTLDVWVADPADSTRHYVVHYLIDFGMSLGVNAIATRDLRRGHAYRIDVRDMTRSLVGMGLLERTWEDRAAPAITGVAAVDVATYDPGSWKPKTPGYVPFLYADDRDRFWGAKILMRFTPEHIGAAVDAARFTDPRAAAYLTRVLIARQRKTALHWFERVNPLDNFVAKPGALCFDDLTITNGLANVGARTRYDVRRYDRRGRALDRVMYRYLPVAGGTRCVPLSLGPDRDGYTIVEIATRRGSMTRTVYVHLARDPATARPRPIGIWRP